MKIYKKKECEDCSTSMENEVMNKLLGQLRETLGVPDGKDILLHAQKIMRNDGD